MRGPVRVGVIGVGNIGAYHASYLAGGVAGAVLAAVSDADRGRAEEVAASAGGGPLGGTETARVHADGASLIGDPTVDAVVVASPNDTHAELVLECLARGKPVLCEKPLGSTAKSCLQVAESEAAGGRHLVQVGFMRRYDRAHRRLKAAVASGRIGDPLIVHCAHRNRASGPGATSAGSLMGSAIHEIDTMRWILGQELVGATVVRARRSPLVTGALCDPQLVLLETGEGVVVDVEVFVNCGYGYDVRCEVVGSEGTATLTSGEEPTVASVGRSGHAVPADWRERFGPAYREELQGWVNGLAAGRVDGPGAWDGYAATAVARACVESLETGARAKVVLEDRPPFYSGEGEGEGEDKGKGR